MGVACDVSVYTGMDKILKAVWPMKRLGIIMAQRKVNYSSLVKVSADVASANLEC